MQVQCQPCFTVTGKHENRLVTAEEPTPTARFDEGGRPFILKNDFEVFVLAIARS
jgi:hypothetical protein